MTDSYKKEWEESYSRDENNILYPHAEVVKFLNRFIRKKIDFKNNYHDILKSDHQIKGFDFGCGVARSAILFEEFGIEAYGTDISEIAINKGKENSKLLGYSQLSERLKSIDSNKLPFENNFFDFSVAESCLDSMRFENAKEIIIDISRITKKYIYFSVIGKEANEKDQKAEDIIIDLAHEKGTIQSYYDEEKINALLSDIECKVIYMRKITEEGIFDKHIDSRYFVVIELI